MKLDWVEKLSLWFERQSRNLPWRQTYEPYSVWLSEVMLQQTQVTTVIPYYEKFLKKFPKVERLAQAELEEVYALWAGLGYYSRARNLHRAAQVICETFGGKFPETREALLTVPGIGPYTAGAVSSIAYNRPAPIVDGNVERVYSRLFAIDDEIKSKPAQEKLWKMAQLAVEKAASPRIFNQAVMELGALVCIKGTPRCGQCPIQDYCKAFAKNEMTLYPKKKERRKTVELHWLGLVFENNGKWWLTQNEARRWWKGLWDFPVSELKGPDEIEKELKTLAAKFDAKEIIPLAPRRHTVTHHKIHLQPVLIRLSKRQKLPVEGKWFGAEALAEMPLSSPARQVASDLTMLQ